MLLNKCYARSFSRNMLSSTPYFKIQALQCWCIESTGNEIQFQSLQHQRQEKDQLRDTSAKVCLTRQLGCNGIEALHFRSSTWSHHGNADGTLQFFSFFFFQFETLLSENFARERWFFGSHFTCTSANPSLVQLCSVNFLFSSLLSWLKLSLQAQSQDNSCDRK